MSTRRPVLLTVDLSYQCYRAAAAHPTLTWMDTFTGGLYGFMATLAKTIRETSATHVVGCVDSKPYLRSRDYPEYKQLRKKTRDDDLYELYLETEPLVHDLLRELGVPVWAVAGFEADDLAAHAVRHASSRWSRIYAASNDSDLYQLLTVPNFAVFKDERGTAVDAAALRARFAMSPEEFMLASALQGTHNDIAGIAGVGVKTAAKIVKDPALLRRYRDSHGAVIDRNLALIKLPHPEFPRSSRLPGRTGPFDARRLYRWAGKYGIEVTGSMVSSFEQVAKEV